MAEEKPYLTGRTYLFRLPKGKDLLEELIDFCHDNQVKCGTVSVVGSVSNATIGYYDQAKKKFEKLEEKIDNLEKIITQQQKEENE